MTDAMHERNTYWTRERECEQLFAGTGPYYMVTTAQQDWLLYKSREEFIAGTNMVAVSAALSGFTIVDDVQMNNHHHMIGYGSVGTVESFVEILREKGRRLQLALGNRSLKDWNIRIDETADLRQFRNQVGYVDRNAFVARRDSTPTGYPWGSAYLFFNGNLWMQQEGKPWGELSIARRRDVCRSHDVCLPERYRVLDRMILRSSFVDYERTESLFNSANQYFSMLTRHGEADIEIARLLGEGIQLPNEEVFQIVGGWFPGQKISTMSMEEKFVAARKMKKQLGCTNKQIVQILQLAPNMVDQLFPHPR